MLTIKQVAIFISFFLIFVQSSLFCFQKHNKKVDQKRKKDHIELEHHISSQQSFQSQFRSYHPHYLNSISYPYPITPHFYYGQVIGATPIFLFKNLQSWNPASIEGFNINGMSFTDASAKYYLLRREEEFRYMLVLQIQNSFDHQFRSTIDIFRRNDHFLIVCQYAEKSNSYFLYLTFEERIISFNQSVRKGINLFIRNESIGDTRQNWKFSQKVLWHGRNNIINMKSTSYAGLIVEIQYFDRQFLKSIKVNLQELPPNQLKNPQQINKNYQQFSFTSIPLQKINKYSNCSNSATQKVFDGLSYEYGRLHIKRGQINIINEPNYLLSFCPSRKRFPWGFLWDDGFHCEVAVREDEALAMKVIKSWLDTMLDDGWIPREQNRGAEREYLCSCPRFMEKDVRDGNPPTLILALDYLKRKNRLNLQLFENQYWKKLKKWYHWFLQTQKEGNYYFFRWHDSINQIGASFTSGMDDFPRPIHCKAHIDLQSWMYFFTKLMAEVSHIFGQSSTEYIANLELIKKNFKFFIQINTKLYKDISNDTMHSEHFGYPSILPIAFGVPEYHSQQYNATIAAIKEHLDGGFGLTSISKHSSHYLQNRDAYWKGPVWININYLFLRGLKLFYPQQLQLYNKIRADLLGTVCGNWQKTGYFYENYIRGVGSFSYPFNGWTSLISIISTQNY